MAELSIDAKRICQGCDRGPALTSSGRADLLAFAPVEDDPSGYCVLRSRSRAATFDAERLVHGRWRNLVVMATGTGKTVVAALDYRRLRKAGHVDSLLFVAHQEQIPRQSRSVFRQVMGDGSFGETLVGGDSRRTGRTSSPRSSRCTGRTSTPRRTTW